MNLEQDDGQEGGRRSEILMQQDPDQVGKEDDKASTGGVSSLDFENFLSDFENGMAALELTTEPADEGTSTLEPPWAFMRMNNSSNSKDAEQKLSTETKEKKNRRRCPRTFLGNVARTRVGCAS